MSVRYRLMATYRGVPYEAGIGPTEDDVVLFAACPPPEELGFEPATGHWRKQLRMSDVQSLWESRPMGSFRGERCMVLDDLGSRLHIAYLGHDSYRAEQLGYWEVDRGVFEVITPREEVTEIAEERREFPLRPGAATNGHRVDSGGADMAGGFGGSSPRADTPADSGAGLLPPVPPSGPPGRVERDIAVAPPDRERSLPLEEAARLAATARAASSAFSAASALGVGSAAAADRDWAGAADWDWAGAPDWAHTTDPGSGTDPAGAAATEGAADRAGPADLSPIPAPARDGSNPPRRRGTADRRLATQRTFSELAGLAAIPRSAFAVGEDVDGAMCLIQTSDGYEVFNSADGARHEVRVFDDEESAYFYLFGVLAAEAVRTGRLAPQG